MTNARTNHHSLYPREDREALSALFDGELPADAARFAFKRLDHDAEWRDTCGRWQLIGDAMRGEAAMAAPAGFATSVMRALETQAAHAVPAAGSQPLPAREADAARRRWIGGAALAASVAVAAVLAVRPYMQPASPAGQLAGAAAAAQASPAHVPPPVQGAMASQPASAGSAPAATIAEAPASRPTVRVARAASRPARSGRNGARSIPGERATLVAASGTAAAEAARPFHPPADEIVTRPWPRAVLPAASTGPLTVGFGAQQAGSSSFYPFEPRLPAEAAPVEPQR